MSWVGLIGVDIGTSGCKVSLIDSHGHSVVEAVSTYAPVYPREGWAEQDPDDWYQAAVSSVHKLLARPEARKVKVAGIGVTGQMISAVFVGKNDRPIYPAILWMDQRTSAEVEWLQKHGEEISGITKTPINTAYTLPRVLWLRNNLPGIWQATHKILLAKDYIRLRFTGEYATDPSDGSGTLLLDSERRDWSKRITEIARIPADILPPVISSHEVAGKLTEAAADNLGLSPGIPVVTGAGDLFAENLAAGNFTASQRLIRFGSCGSVSSPLTRPVLDPKRRCPCYVHCVPNYWLIETSTQAFGLAEGWFKRELLSNSNVSVHSLMDELAASIAPGADGLIFHPFIQGAPYWDPNLKGGFVGITPAHTKAHFARAVLEGITYSLLDAIRLLDNAIGGKGASVEWRAIGGGTASPVWAQIVADAIGSDLLVLRDASPSIGAAILAGVGTGVIPDYHSALGTIPTKLVKYDESTHALYQEEYKQYRIVHARLSL